MKIVYLDKECDLINSNLNLKINNKTSALWLRSESFSLVSSIKMLEEKINHLIGYLWLTFSTELGSKKMNVYKRAFGHWQVKKNLIVHESEYTDENKKLWYSDVAEITESSLQDFSPIIDREMFGIDSSLFYLPKNSCKDFQKFVSPLEELFFKRNSSDKIVENELNVGFIEQHVNFVTSSGGIAFLVIVDSNRQKTVVALSNQNIMSELVQSFDGDFQPHVQHNTDSFIKNSLKVGVSLPVFGI